MSLIWMSHITDMNESSHTYRLGITSLPNHLPISMSHATRRKKSCHTYEWVVTHMNIWPSHGTLVNESCHTHMNESWSTYEWLMYTHMHESFFTYNCRHGIVSVPKYIINVIIISLLWKQGYNNVGVLWNWHYAVPIIRHIIIIISLLSHVNVIIISLIMSLLYPCFHTYDWVTGYIWMLHATHMNETRSNIISSLLYAYMHMYIYV